jgi:hypothetical protein
MVSELKLQLLSSPSLKPSLTMVSAFRYLFSRKHKRTFFWLSRFLAFYLCKYLILYFSFRGKLKFFSYDVRNDEKDCNFGLFGKVAFTVNI